MLTKSCTKCGIEKETSEFYKLKTGKYSVNTICKECKNIYNKKYRINNKEKTALYHKKWQINNKEAIALHQRRWRKNNTEHVKQYSKKYSINNRVKIKQYHKDNKEELAEYQKKYIVKNKNKLKQQKRQYYKDNKDKFLAYGKKYRKKYYQNNRERYKALSKRWAQTNPDKVSAKRAKRRACKLAQTPVLTKQETQDILLYYTLAQYLSEFGTKHEVDHIAPLAKGGLHHPSNLQVLTQRDNRCKSAKLNYECQDEVYKL